jgi:hypothetical protein
MRINRSPLLLLAAALLSAAAVGSEAKSEVLSARFKSAYAAALAQAAASFEKGAPAEGLIAPLEKLAGTGLERAKVEELRGRLAAMEKPCAPADVKDEKDLLDPACAAAVRSFAVGVGADPARASDSYRRVRAAEREAKAHGAAATALAQPLAKRLAADPRGGDLAGAGAAAAVATPKPGAASAAREDMRASDFKPSEHLKIREDIPDYFDPMIGPTLTMDDYRQAWSAAKVALTTPWAGAQEAYKSFADRRMKDSDDRKERAASLQNQGGAWNYGNAYANYAAAWGDRLAAGDSDAVAQGAVGTGVAIAAVVAAPLVLPAAGATALTGGAVVGTTVGAGLAGLTAGGLFEGAFHLLKEPTAGRALLVSAGLVSAKYVGILHVVKKSENLVEKGVTAMALNSSNSKAASVMIGALTAVSVRVEVPVHAVASKTVGMMVGLGVSAFVKSPVLHWVSMTH